VTVNCDLSASASLSGVATVVSKHSPSRTRLSLGAVHGTLPAGRSVTLTLKPPAKVLSRIRAAARKRARITLTFSLTATNSAAIGTATGSVAVLKVTR
jgi:hypothetical protein